MNGRQKIEAAFSQEGTPEIPAIICYEDIFYRDHWDSLTTLPWWYAQSPDIKQQLSWRREIIPKVGQDWMVLSACPARQYRNNHNIILQEDGVYITDHSSDDKEKLLSPRESSWKVKHAARNWYRCFSIGRKYKRLCNRTS